MTAGETAQPLADGVRLSGAIADDLFERLCWNNGPLRYDGETYQLATEEQLRELGENPLDPQCPLILHRPADGAFFEVEVDVTAWETSAEAREADRERMRKMLARTQRAGGAS